MFQQFTATEIAACDEDAIHEFMKRREFRLASMNSRARDALLDAIVEENGIRGGWCWTDGSMPLNGPFETEAEAKADAEALCGRDPDEDDED